MLDPGAFAGANTVILSVVDIGTVRLVANLVEKDFKRVAAGVQAQVEVDAFPGEQFTGRREPRGARCSIPRRARRRWRSRSRIPASG